MLRHEKTCEHGTKFKYKEGVHHPRRNIFQMIEDLGITVENELKFYPFQAVFDRHAETQKHGFGVKHIPLSFCVVTNVPGFATPCFEVSQGDSQSLVNKMLDHLFAASEKAFELLKQKYEPLMDQLKPSVCANEQSWKE